MTYKEIITNNCKNCIHKWWPQFAYHFTDVSNVVSILKTGFLYSRIEAEETHIMKNDNASNQVIDMTDSDVISKVRFYFRPLTPTQYYNEGFKHPELRYNSDTNANIPVTIFFVFDLEKLLSLPETSFSEKTQAGYGSKAYQGTEAFSKLNFEKIYSDGPLVSDEKAFRQAEILYPDKFPINHCLKFIICRNEIEKATLLNLLKSEDEQLFSRYKNMIRINKEAMFENNGLFITDFAYKKNAASFTFSDTYEKHQYETKMLKNLEKNIEGLARINCEIRFEWLNDKHLLHTIIRVIRIRLDQKILKFENLPEIEGANLLRIKFFMKNKLMCHIEQNLENSELL